MKVLVALDDSEASLRAAIEAHHLFPDGEFFVVNVSRRSAPWLVGDYGMGYLADMSMYADMVPDPSHVSSLAAAAGIADPDVEAVVGDPAGAICDAAEAHDVDVVVVGSHDKGMLRRLVDPSVAQAVVRGTHRPVLVVSGHPPR